MGVNLPSTIMGDEFVMEKLALNVANFHQQESYFSKFAVRSCVFSIETALKVFAGQVLSGLTEGAPGVLNEG